jgi:hypothetical protein
MAKKKPTKQELIDHVELLVAKCEELTRERDEARQIACNREAELNRMMFDNPKYSDPAAIAAQRDWDCFKENTEYLQDLG